MQSITKPVFWMMPLLWSALVAPLGVSATEQGTGPGAENSTPAEPVCREEAYTGSRIKTLVCRGDESYEQGTRLGEFLQRPGERQFTRSMRFPGVSVQAGTVSSVSVHR